MAAEIKLYTQAEAAELLGVDVATLCRWRKKKVLTAHKYGRWVRYTPDDIQDFLNHAQESKTPRARNTKGGA